MAALESPSLEETKGGMIVLHPDNHHHHGLRGVFQELLEAALAERIVLLCEGSPHRVSGGRRRVECHGIAWEGTHPHVNGLESESGEDLPRLAWAAASRLATGSGAPEEDRLSDSPLEGALLIRSLCILFSLLDPTHSAALRDPAVADFVAELRRRLPPGGGDFWEGGLHRAAHEVMRSRQSKWPGASLTFGDAARLCRDCMPHVGLGDAPFEEAIDEVLVVEREARWATTLAAAAGAPLPVHVILGASHCMPALPGSHVEALHLDPVAFHRQAQRIHAPRLSQMVECRVTDDPFCSGVEDSTQE